jgi:hypothetical protein
MAARSAEPLDTPGGEEPSSTNRGGAGISLGADSSEVKERVLPVGHVDPVTTATEGPDGGADSPMTRGQMSVQSRQELSTIMSTAVLPKTNGVYEKEWESFKAFVKKETGSDDPFLTECTEDEKATVVALMMMRRHEAGKRGKAATSFRAAVRQMYARTMPPTALFESSVITTARVSCASSEAAQAPSLDGQRTGRHSQTAHVRGNHG